MMKGKIIIAAVLLLATLLSAQYLETPSGAAIRVTLTDTDTSSFYVLKPYSGAVYCAATAPTYSNFHGGRWSVLSTFSMKATASTGMAAGETDSLKVTCEALIQDHVNKAIVVDAALYFNATFGPLGEAALYSYYFDWADGSTYSQTIKDSNDNAFSRDRVIGWKITVIQANSTSGIGIYDFNLIFN
jgi:hypothetical protein